jgi:V-type H+-transporting ATPase subunit d
MCHEQAGGIAPSVIQGGMTNKLVEEFLFLRAQASEPLGQFLDLIT